MNYKSLSQVLKYSHDAFHNILSQMTHDDWKGEEEADFTKRGVLADAYKEMRDDKGLGLAASVETDAAVELLVQLCSVWVITPRMRKEQQ